MFEHANEVLQDLEQKLASVAEQADAKIIRLERRLQQLEDSDQELSQRLIEAERQANRLMNLYVATYQLHSTLEPSEVQTTIADIAINLLGAEMFFLLLKTEQGDFEVSLAEGIDKNSDSFANGCYAHNDPIVDATLADGVLRLGPFPGTDTLAVVPLAIQDSLVGVLVIKKLLDHKPLLSAIDRELLDILAAHAASALFVARLHDATQRKLKTLEGLFSLIRK